MKHALILVSLFLGASAFAPAFSNDAFTERCDLLLSRAEAKSAFTIFETLAEPGASFVISQLDSTPEFFLDFELHLSETSPERSLELLDSIEARLADREVDAYFVNAARRITPRLLAAPAERIEAIQSRIKILTSRAWSEDETTFWGRKEITRISFKSELNTNDIEFLFESRKRPYIRLDEELLQLIDRTLLRLGTATVGAQESLIYEFKRGDADTRLVIIHLLRLSGEIQSTRMIEALLRCYADEAHMDATGTLKPRLRALLETRVDFGNPLLVERLKDLSRIDRYRIAMNWFRDRGAFNPDRPLSLESDPLALAFARERAAREKKDLQRKAALENETMPPSQDYDAATALSKIDQLIKEGETSDPEGQDFAANFLFHSEHSVRFRTLLYFSLQENVSPYALYRLIQSLRTPWELARAEKEQEALAYPILQDLFHKHGPNNAFLVEILSPILRSPNGSELRAQAVENALQGLKFKLADDI